MSAIVRFRTGCTTRIVRSTDAAQQAAAINAIAAIRTVPSRPQRVRRTAEGIEDVDGRIIEPMRDRVRNLE